MYLLGLGSSLHSPLSELCRATAKLLGHTKFCCRDMRLSDGGLRYLLLFHNFYRIHLYLLLPASLGLSYLSGTF